MDDTSDELANPEAVALRIFNLSIREREILKAIAAGRRNYEIADIHGISPRTVEKHVERILRKLGVKNRAQAAYIGALHATPQTNSDTAPVGDFLT